MTIFPRRLPARLVALALTLSLGAGSGCAALGIDDSGAGSAADGSGGSLDDGRVDVAAAFYPLAWVAERVGGDRAEVGLLTQPGGEPHDLELSVSETARIARADLVLLEGGFQASVDDAVASGEVAGEVLDVRDVVDLRPLGDEHDHEHDHAGDHEEGEGESHDEEEALAGLDPHFWQDPLLLADYADAVAEELGAVDAAHAEAYAGRAARLRTTLEELDAAYAAGLSGCARDVVLVNHDAFGYLTRYGLEFEPIAGLSPDAEPTPADLARLQRVARDEGVTTVFSEALVSPRTARTLASDLGIEAEVLDPVEGLSAGTADEDYLSLMRNNLEALREANGC